MNLIAQARPITLTDQSVAWNVYLVVPIRHGSMVQESIVSTIGANSRSEAIVIETAINNGAAWVSGGEAK